MNPIYTTIINEALTPIIGILVAAAVAGIAKFFQKAGIDIEAKNRDALQSALANAAKLAVDGLTSAPPLGSVVMPSAEAIDYIKNSVPDALKKFGIDKKDTGKITDLMRPHIVEAVLRKFNPAK